MKKYLGILAGTIMVLTLCLIVPNTAWAVQGACVNCHTMHNSQDGSAVNSSGPNEYLLNNDCIGCHTGENDGASTHAPYVMRDTAPTYGPDYDSSGNLITNGTTLAGGNFYWVANVADADGHNVDLVANQDATLGNTPPGGTGSLSQQLTCAGTYGCHGDRTVNGNMAAIKGAHHSNTTGALTTADTVGNSYRFLLGIYGNEDSDYEYQPTATAHNQYYGTDRTSETETDTHTISYFCAECHGDFHNGSGNLTPSGGSFGSPWLRHPTDYDMANTPAGSEYRGYVGADGSTAGQYNVVAPVASHTVTSVVQTIQFANDDAIVMCLSCHRAHGSPYADILRWDYTKMVAGNAGGYANKGCFACHTTKD